MVEEQGVSIIDEAEEIARSLSEREYFGALSSISSESWHIASLLDDISRMYGEESWELLLAIRKLSGEHKITVEYVQGSPIKAPTLRSTLLRIVGEPLAQRVSAITGIIIVGLIGLSALLYGSFNNVYSVIFGGFGLLILVFMRLSYSYRSIKR